MLPVSMVMGQSVSAGRLDDPKGEYQIKCLQPGRTPQRQLCVFHPWNKNRPWTTPRELLLLEDPHCGKDFDHGLRQDGYNHQGAVEWCFVP